MRAIGFAAIASTLIAAAPISAAADQTIIESFSLTIPSLVVPGSGQSDVFFLSTPFPAFPSTIGTLDKVTATISGSIKEASIADNPTLALSFGVDTSITVFADGDVFNLAPSGTININLSGTAPTDDFDFFNGVLGTPVASIDVDRFSVPANTTVIESVGPLTGSITYTYTPAATLTLSVPEPSTWAMMLLGFVGLGYAGVRARGGFRLAA
jgi:hypothetical protein